MTLGLLTLLALVTPGASTGLQPDWDADAAQLTRQNAPRVVDASRGIVFGLRWREPLVRTGVFRTVIASFGRPAISQKHGVVVVGSGEGEVRAHDLDDGSLRWRVSYPVPFETDATLVALEPTPAHRADEQVVLGSREGGLMALDVTSGAQRWQARLDGEARAPLVALGDKLLVATANNKVALLSAENGKIVWSVGRPPPSGLTIQGHAAAAVDASAGVVFTSFSDGYAEAFALADGKRLWSQPLSIHGGKFIDADADPFLAEGRLFVASYSDGLYALDPRDGRVLWQRSMPAVTSIARYRDWVLAASADGWLWAVDQSNGELVYRTRLPPGPMSRLRVAGRLVAFAAGDSGLVAVDARSGRPVQCGAYGARMASDPVWVGRDLALVSTDGYLFAFRLGEPGPVRPYQPGT